MKNPGDLKYIIALGCMVFVLSAWGGEGGKGGNSNPSGASEPSMGQERASEEGEASAGVDDGLWPFFGNSTETGYAQVVRFDLELLSVPDLVVGDVTVVEGADLVEDLVVDGGELRFITPGDRGRSGRIRLRMKGRSRDLVVAVHSNRFLEIGEITEFYENDPDQVPVTLHVKGLGPSNAIGHEDLVFEADRNIEVDPIGSNALLEVDGSGFESLRGVWTLTPSKRGLVVKRDDLLALLDKLPEGDISFSVSINGAGRFGDFSRKWVFVAHRPQARVDGRLMVPETGDPVRDLVGRKVALIGEGANATRLVTVLDEEGRFSVEGLSPGHYAVELLDSRAPGFTKSYFTKSYFQVKRQDKQVSVDIPYWKPLQSGMGGKDLIRDDRSHIDSPVDKKAAGNERGGQ